MRLSVDQKVCSAVSAFSFTSPPCHDLAVLCMPFSERLLVTRLDWVSKHAIASMGQHSGRAFSAIVNHLVMPLLNVFQLVLLSHIRSGTKGAGLAFSMSSTIANSGHLSSLASSALKPYLLAKVASTTVRIPVKAMLQVALEFFFNFC